MSVVGEVRSSGSEWWQSIQLSVLLLLIVHAVWRVAFVAAKSGNRMFKWTCKASNERARGDEWED